ncbi:MAG: lipoate--protein ligase family protein [bacterium]|jgi:lipoate---protein ligase
MIFIRRPETDPWFNIAAEEYLLKHRTEDIAMLWQCDPAVIIGKHQNAMAEANLNWTGKRNIPVIRRITGGGTVYHDSGNINYTVIRTVEQREKMIDFRQFTRPVIDFLSELGIISTFEGKNNLVIEGKKISGNSAHVHKNRVIHHGTILFDSNLEILNESIRPTNLHIEDKSVQSIRATVTNIRPFLVEDMNTKEFKSLLEKYLINHHNINSIDSLTFEANKAISRLAEEKYRGTEWTFGYSPVYSVYLPIKTEGGQNELKVKVVRGIINEITLDFEGESDRQIMTALQKLKGRPHHGLHRDDYFRTLKEQFPGLKELQRLL